MNSLFLRNVFYEEGHKVHKFESFGNFGAPEKVVVRIVHDCHSLTEIWMISRTWIVSL